MLTFMKKMISRAIYPFNFALLLVLTGLFFLSGNKRKLIGKWLIGIGLSIFLISSYWPFASWIAGTLEHQFQPLAVENTSSHEYLSGLPKNIMVLNGGAIFDKEYPPTSILSRSTIDRMTEAIRLYRLIPEAKIYLSSAQGKWLESIGEKMHTFVIGQGIPKEDVFIMRTGVNTAGEALVARKIFGKEQFILVTSAIHMPRSMMLFHRFGLDPVPAPVRYHTMQRKDLSLDHLMPTVRASELTEWAVHEYVGILWGYFTENGKDR